jgi:predicted nucleotide-binding protein
MFPLKGLEKIHEELHRYYLQVVTYQNEDQEYQDILTKLSKNLSELEYTIKNIRKYNKNMKNQLIS